MRLTVETDEDLSYVVLEDPLPSGFEVIRDVRFDPKADTFLELTVRDEKIALFSNFLKQGKHIFNYALRPELTGDFHVMPSQGYQMYRPAVRGSGAEVKLQVK